LEVVEADQGTAEVQEGAVHRDQPFVADRQTPIPRDPSKRPFDDPAVTAQLGLRGSVTFGSGCSLGAYSPARAPVPDPVSLYRGRRFPREVIAHAVRLYPRFALSLRDVEELLAERGVVVGYETVRRRVATFGAAYADELRKRDPRAGRTWHMDEMAVRVGGKRHWLWRAVDEHGTALDVLLQERRDTAAAARFFRRLLAATGGAPPARITTDKLGSCAAARAHLPELAGVEHLQGRSAMRCNNRVEQAHQPTRVRARVMRRFKSVESAQRFLDAFARVGNLFRPGRHRLSAAAYRTTMRDRGAAWREVVGLRAA
jgi:putative transposase